jgi:LysR family transcriptional regulator, hca operon transcriptional activator
MAMELRHLRYFIAVAEVGSVSLAAEQRLHTSQPSLSRQIRDLEEQVGTPLFVRTARGVELTDAGRAFHDHARLALHQVDAAIEAARRAALPAKQRFALGFLTGHEITWLSKAMRILQPDLSNIDVTVSSDYSPDLGDAVARGTLDLAFMRKEPNLDLAYRVVQKDPLVVLLPSDHRLASRKSISPKDLAKQPYIAMGHKAELLRAVIDGYLAEAGIALAASQEVDNPAMVMSLVASTRGVAIAPSYLENLMPWSVVSRPFTGRVPVIELVVGYSESNRSPYLRNFLERLTSLDGEVSRKAAS